MRMMAEFLVITAFIVATVYVGGILSLAFG